jgi:2-keto-4-pentenoate hydratase/2-oxohepta-3-ene-1,7-dioic acid hydratase in catechol pathway
LTHFPVCPNDIILTGTPAGVSQVNPGDNLTGKISDYYTANWMIHEKTIFI